MFQFSVQLIVCAWLICSGVLHLQLVLSFDANMEVDTESEIHGVVGFADVDTDADSITQKDCQYLVHGKQLDLQSLNTSTIESTIADSSSSLMYSPCRNALVYPQFGVTTPVMAALLGIQIIEPLVSWDPNVQPVFIDDDDNNNRLIFNYSNEERRVSFVVVWNCNDTIPLYEVTDALQTKSKSKSKSTFSRSNSNSNSNSNSDSGSDSDSDSDSFESDVWIEIDTYTLYIDSSIICEIITIIQNSGVDVDVDGKVIVNKYNVNLFYKHFFSVHFLIFVCSVVTFIGVVAAILYCQFKRYKYFTGQLIPDDGEYSDNFYDDFSNDIDYMSSDEVPPF